MAASPLGLARRVAGDGTFFPAAAHSSSRPRGFHPRLFPSKRLSGVVRMGSAVGGGQEGEEEEEVRQAKEMVAARRRWETLIREQKIKTLTPREAGYTFKLTDKVLLDVRPSNERQKAWVKGSTWIPVFDMDTSFDLGGLGKKVTNFVMGGWWSGISTMSFNENILQQVGEKFSKGTDIILVCQKGLRSLAACEKLYIAGFQNLFWVQGGLEAAEDESGLPNENEGEKNRNFARPRKSATSRPTGARRNERPTTSEERGYGAHRNSYQGPLYGVTDMWATLWCPPWDPRGPGGVSGTPTGFCGLLLRCIK